MIWAVRTNFLEGAGVRVISITGKVKAMALAERYGWPLDGAEGYVEGEQFRTGPRAPSNPLPPHLLVGSDEYAKGFRAGYYGRPASPTTLTGR